MRVWGKYRFSPTMDKIGLGMAEVNYPDRNVSGDSFGYDLALSQDFLVVGAPHAIVAENVQGLKSCLKR